MNRLIKFRAWIDKYGYIIYSGQHKELEGFTFNNDDTITIYEGDGDQEYNSEDAHLMQFTGLFDKNGKEIYEGDIIDFAYNNFVIEFADARFKALLIGRKDDAQILGSKLWLESEVIGNIYQNKELLIELTSEK